MTDPDWTPTDATAHYQIDGWGQGMFHVADNGHLWMCPDGDPSRGIDLKRLTQDMRRRGVSLPILVRFTDIIRRRIDDLHDAFSTAISEWEYAGRYRPVFPVKVNPQSYVMRDILRHGKRHRVGLEAGSKPELMAVLAQLDDPEGLIICNGYKDAAYIRLALLARKLGHEIVIVVEKPDEVDIALEEAAHLDVELLLGVRARLDTTGVGHWATSTGDRAKFGLSVGEIVTMVDQLRAADRLDSLRLLHFHIGSQISQVRTFRNAIREGARIYAELRRLGAPMGLLDVGGGLGVDYDGNASTDVSSVNYNLREYAHAVVGTISDVCIESGVTHPDIITESGRAMVAHHSVLLTEVLDRTGRDVTPPPRPKPGEPVPRQVETAWEVYDHLHPERLVEALHDIEAIRREGRNRFNLGLLDLEQRAYLEQMYWAIGHRILELADEVEEENDEIDALRLRFVESWFCNLSVFQSLPDMWAIDQLFPIVPIQRLNEPPDTRAILADLTCDSDGKIARFIGDREVNSWLDVHTPRKGERYVIGVFLVGAYQEILGDLHNLFGDTHALHVATSDNKQGYTVLHLDEGDIIEEVLGYVHHNAKDLVSRLRAKVEEATEAGRIDIEEGTELVTTFIRGLDDYTYLSR